MAVHRAPQPAGRWRKLPLVVIAPLVVAVGLATVLLSESETDAQRDGDLCPTAGDAPNQGALLVDLRKPLGADGPQLVNDVLRDATVALPGDAELRVYTLTGDATAPRQLLRRFCKPYANSDLAVSGAKEDAAPVRDCADLPAQLPTRVRDRAQRFCAIRAEVGAELGRAVSRPLAIPVPNAFLVEAIEETALSFAASAPARGARSFFVLSDMLQHADWFSHVERGMAGWGFSDFIYLREMAASSVGPRPAPLTDVGVTIFYLPRTGWTEAPRPRMTHTAFWERYFSDAMGAVPELRTLAVLGDYAVVPLMDQLSEAEKLAQERERLEAEVARLEAAMDAERRQAEARAAEQAEAAARREAEREAAERQAAARQAERREDERREAERLETERREAERQAAEQAAPAEDAEPTPTPPGPEAVPAGPEIAANPASPPADAPPAPAQSEPPPVDAAAVSAVAGEAGSCSATLLARYRKTNAYPRGRRVNFGSATIVVEFELDEQGWTVDDSVQVVDDASRASRPMYFGIFSAEAISLARGWEFAFDPNETDCVRRQSSRLTVEFKF